MYLDKDVMIYDDIGLILMSKTNFEKTYQYTINELEHNWIDFWVNSKTKMLVYVSAFEVIISQKEVVFKFIQPNLNEDMYTMIYTIERPSEIFFESLMMGEKEKISIMLEYQ